MKPTDAPLFTNSCGRVFGHKIQLASYKGETTVPVREISSLSFRTKITAKGFLFSLLPAVLLGVSFLTKVPAEKTAFMIAGVLGVALMLYKAERKHVLRISFKKGRSRDIVVWSSNIKEAKKYVNEANKVVASFDVKSETFDNKAVKVLATNH